MNLKKKLCKFFTLRRRHDAGFTLVELIVVIAILAILAGVGTVGYSGYIKSSNKNADKVLVGNIIRAIETGTYSYTVELNEVLQASEKGAKLPIGFVVLTKDGVTVMESASTQMAVTANDACEKQTVTLYNTASAGKDKWKSGCDTKEEDVYTVSVAEEVDICKTHSSLNTTSVRVWQNGYTSNSSDDTEESETKSYVLREGSTIVLIGNGHEHGQKAVAGNYYDFVLDAQGNYTTANDQGAIMEALKAAFGDDLDLALKSDDWTVSTIPSFWSNATDTWGNVQRLSDMMYDLTSGFTGSAIARAMNIGQYGSSGEIVYSVAIAVKNSFDDKQKFVDRWAIYGQYGENEAKYGGDNFGINGSQYPGREYYSAMRGAYNNCVASYVKQHHAVNATYTQSTVDAHVAALAAYGESAGELVQEKLGTDWGLLDTVLNSIAGENFPRQICKASFTTDGGKAYGGVGAACPECYRCYKEYISSGADKVDAAAVYDTFMTAADADPMLLEGNLTDEDGNAVDFFSYYENYLKEFEGMYNAATGLANGASSIVIQIFYEDGLLTCEVSPSAANPRIDD